MATEIHNLEKLLEEIPNLRRLEGFKDIFGDKYPIDPVSEKTGKRKISWSILKTDQILRMAFQEFILLFVSWHAKKIGKTPSIGYIDRVFLKADCGYFGSHFLNIGLFDGSYRNLVASLGLTPNDLRYRRGKSQSSV